MTYPARIKATKSDGGFQVMCEILHPMETGNRNYAGTSVAILANYITQVTFRKNGEIQAQLLLGKYVSSNPVVGTWFKKLKKGDEISVSWQDISGNGGQQSLIIS
jgi:thiosulfate oxidation carrier complex protein SoxZ